MLGLLGILIFYIVLFLLSFSVATTVVWLMARMLQFFFDFTIFESMLLSTFFTAFAGYAIVKITDVTASIDEQVDEIRYGSNSNIRRVRMPDGLPADRDVEFETIPDSRFFKSPSERTWENWLHKEVANDIYAEFQDNTQAVSNLNESQTQELAIRLSDLTLAMLKRKTARARKLKITKNALVKEVEKNGQRAYDDQIIKLAVAAFNMNMDYYNDELLRVVRGKSWGKKATIQDD